MGEFAQDVAFLKQHTDVVVLRREGAAVAVAPAYQGRVMTSTVDHQQGASFGWINRPVVKAGFLPEVERKGKIEERIYVFGGEDRFWLGPEGGQFSIYFKKDAPFDGDHWYTPAPIDTDAYEVVRQTDDRVVCQRAFSLVNYSGTKFDIEATREVRLLEDSALNELGVTLTAGVEAVAFESVNTIKNTGPVAWKKETGLLSIWILGMYRASTESMVVIPYQQGDEAKLGPVVNDDYFGKAPPDRLTVGDGVVFFKADAGLRCKIGLSPQRAKPLLGSYDSAGGTLTLVSYTHHPGEQDYVNSAWELQDEPYRGDVVNSYTDDGNLGTFYELESSSPALALAPGESATHVHRTLHLQGSKQQLDEIARKTLGVGLDAIDKAFTE